MAQHRHTPDPRPRLDDRTRHDAGTHNAGARRGAHRAGRPTKSSSGTGLLGLGAVALVVAATAGLGMSRGGTSEAPTGPANRVAGFGAVEKGYPTSRPHASLSSASKSAHPHRKHHGKTRPGSRLPQEPSTSTSASSSPSTHHPDPGGPSSCVTQRQGIPSSGDAYVGGAVGGTASLSSVERGAGQPLAIHRTYFMSNQVDYALRTVKEDLAAGRLPWISFKMPHSWPEMAAGKGDAWAADLADKLAKVGGPVWLALHHEPEGDGNMQDWKRMQQHLAPIVHAHAANVAYTVILMGWNSFSPKGPADQHIADTYPGSKYVDILGVDLYNRYGAKPNVHANLDPMTYFGPIAKFAREHDVNWAIGEIGYTKQAANADPNWLQSTYNDLRQENGLAMAYFNSSRNSMANWTLDDPVRFGAFDSLLARSPRLCSD